MNGKPNGLGIMKPGEVQIVFKQLYPRDGNGEPVAYCPVTPPATINLDGAQPGVVHRVQVFAPCSTLCKKNVNGECTL